VKVQIETDPKSPQSLITAPVLRTVPPPLVSTRTIKSRLSQLDIHFIVRRAEPLCECSARPHVRGAALHTRAEVAGAVGARVEPWQCMEELQHVCTLRRRRRFGVVRRGGVQERPGRAPERLNVRWAVFCPPRACVFFARRYGRGQRSGRRDRLRRVAFTVLGARSRSRGRCLV